MVFSTRIEDSIIAVVAYSFQHSPDNVGDKVYNAVIALIVTIASRYLKALIDKGVFDRKNKRNGK